MKRFTGGFSLLLLWSSFLARPGACAEAIRPVRTVVLFSFQSGPSKEEQTPAIQLTEAMQAALQGTGRYEVLLFHTQAPLVRQALAQGTLTEERLADLTDPETRLEVARVLGMGAALSGEVVAYTFTSEPKGATGAVEVALDIQEVGAHRVVAFHATAEAQTRTPRAPSSVRMEARGGREGLVSPEQEQRRAICMALARILVDHIEEFWPVLSAPEPPSPGSSPLPPTSSGSSNPLEEARQRAAVGELQAASRAYTAAIVADPGNAALYVELGDLLAQAGQWTEARNQYERATRVDCHYLPAYRKLAEAYHRLQQPQGEIQAWLGLIQEGEGGEEIERSLAQAYRTQGDYQQAVAHYERALQMTSDPYPLLLELGQLAEEHQDLPAAAARYEAAQAQRPQDPSAHQQILAFHLRHRQWEPALARLRELLSLPREGEARLVWEEELYFPVLHLLDREAGRLRERWVALRNDREAGIQSAQQVASALEEVDQQVQNLVNLADGIQPEEAFRRSFRHRILAYSLLDQAVVEYLQYLDTEETLSRERSTLLLKQSQDELATAQELERQVGRP